MKYITIGGQILASAIPLGCMRMAGLEEKRVDEIIDCALEHGINFFDHAYIYGKGNSERLFGGYLSRHKGAREWMFIQTKCAIHDGQYDFSKEHIIRSVEGSLSRLGLDYVDFLLLHRPDTLMEPEEVAGRLTRWNPPERCVILACPIITRCRSSCSKRQSDSRWSSTSCNTRSRSLEW